MHCGREGKAGRERCGQLAAATGKCSTRAHLYAWVTSTIMRWCAISVSPGSTTTSAFMTPWWDICTHGARGTHELHQQRHSPLSAPLQSHPCAFAIQAL